MTLMTSNGWERRLAHAAFIALIAVLAVRPGSAEPTAGSRGQDDVTFTADIAPILFEHCVVCHRPGGGGPFSLLSYRAVRERASLVADVTERRDMPPWKPVPGHGIFQGERRLTESQIDLIRRWADGGANEGSVAELPAAPVLAEAWHAGEPDLVVTLDPAYLLPAGSTDVYRNFALPIALDERRWVKAVELRPLTSGVIHHARILIDSTGRARDLDAEDPTPGYDGFMVDSAEFPPGHFLGWAPGKMPTVQPDTLAWALDPGTDFVLQLHLLPGESPVAVEPEVGLYFSDTPATLVPVSVVLNSKTIDIPAGDVAHVVQDSYRLPVAVDLLAITPHMHYLGREIHATATLPDGTERSLLRIDDWDFNWQDEYRYVEPVHLPEGTRLSVRFVFDNSTDNPRNPNSPPQPVRFGPTATDEMAELMLQVLTILPGDQQALLQNLELKRARDDILGYQARLRLDPGDHVSRTGLAVRYLDVGQPELAVEELEAAIRLAPDFALAHYNLGGVFVVQGNKMDEAIAAYRRAVELEPDYSDAHNNLGGLLESTGNRTDAIMHYRLALQFDRRHAGAHYNLANTLLNQGEVDEAIMHYRDALASTPNDPDVHSSLGGALVSQGKRGEAVAHFRRALAVDPNLAGSLVGLAWLLATAPETELRNAREAVVLAERAVELVGNQHPTVLDTLAAAYAADGRFSQAIEAARSAAELARATAGFEALAPRIERRVQLYLAFTPYRTPR